MSQQYLYLDRQRHKMLALHLCLSNSDGLILIAAALFGQISELYFGNLVLSASAT